MSLNGLDDVKVKEAYETAAAEPGGWFLLKYVSRDEIELLGRGNGGIVEVRNTIAQFEEPSPLFGFLRYRRRNVVIKYVPEDCSRLVQARVTVHFNAVQERFSPHDTEFSITSSKELRDTTLSAACSLHTASGSSSSSNSSLRRRRLMEIAEDAEEDDRTKRQSTVPEERPSIAKSPSSPATSTPLAGSVPLPASPPKLPTSESFRSVISNLETSPPPPREPDPYPRPTSPAKTLDERRKSSVSTRPDLYSLSSYGSNGKPKIKLGPRPSLDVGGGRPHTSSATSHFRPISTLPPGLKLFSKGSIRDKDRAGSQSSSETPSMTLSPPPIPETMAGSLQIPTTRPHTSGGRPTTSSGISVKSLTSPKATNFTKLPTMTPEKARLLKAMELRKKREMSSPPRAVEPPLPEIDQLPTSLTPANVGISMGAPKEVHDTLSMLNDMAKGEDSDVAFDASSIMKTDESDATRSESYPVSPVGFSERAESTRASSMSESTDETVQELQTKPEFEEQPAETAAPVSDLHVDVADSSVQAEEEEEGPKEDVEKDLPLLQPIAYTPLSSPFEPPVGYTENESFNTADDATFADLGSSTMENPVLVQDTPTEEPLSLHSTSEVDVTTCAPEPPQKEIEEIENLSEAASVPPFAVEPEMKEWKVPRSKFSSQNLRAASEAPAISNEPMPLSSNESAANAAPKSPADSTFSDDTKRSLTEEDGQENGLLAAKRRKRRAFVEPILTNVNDISAANSEANFSSDDELMEELQSAVFQEAKPISVSKSPLSPVFPSTKNKLSNRFSRAFSNPMRKEASEPQKLSAPDLGRTDSTRSVSASAAYFNRINQQNAKPLAKNVNLGSGISSRIKALEKLSAEGATTTPGATPVSTVASTAFFSVRKGTVRGASRSPSVAERANSLTRNTTTPSPSASLESSPETFKLRERSPSVQSRLNAFSASPVPVQSQNPRPESISVTAKIIRDPKQLYPKFEHGTNSSDYAPLNLTESPLVIDHQKAVIPAPEAPGESVRERRLSTSSRNTTNSRRSSITVVRDLMKDGRASFSDRRRSMNLEPSTTPPPVLSPRGSSSRPPSAHQRPISVSSRRSTSSRDQGLTPPPTAGSESSTNDERDKRSSRASRMLRRMSSSLSSSRKTPTHAMSPTVREESEPPVGMSSRALASSHPSDYFTSPTTTSTSIGDVNVQFPDTLLWKRRSMLLDSQGTLILAPALSFGNSNEKMAGGATRRFHLSEFRTPGIPDVEMQELPCSVVLDFVEGGGLQIACEDRAGQVRVLHVLQEAHSTWAAYGQ